MGKGRGRIRQVSTTDNAIASGVGFSATPSLDTETGKLNLDLAVEYETYSPKSIEGVSKALQGKNKIEFRTKENNRYYDPWLSDEENANVNKAIDFVRKRAEENGNSLTKNLLVTLKEATYEQRKGVTSELTKIGDLIRERLYSIQDLFEDEKVLLSTKSLSSETKKKLSYITDGLVTLNDKFVDLGYKSIESFAIQSDSLDGGTVPLAFYNRPTHKIALVSVLNEGIEHSLDYSQSTGFTAIGHIKGVIAHEYGHHVSKVLTTKDRKKIEDFKTRMEKEEKVSDYSHHTTDEAFAEAFSCYALGTSPNRGLKYYSEFSNLMKEVGLSSMKGILKPKSVDIGNVTPEPIKSPEPQRSVAPSSRLSTVTTPKRRATPRRLGSDPIDNDEPTENTKSTKSTSTKEVTPKKTTKKTATKETTSTSKATKTSVKEEKPTTTTTKKASTSKSATTPKSAEKTTATKSTTKTTKTTTTKTTPKASTPKTKTPTTKYSVGDSHTFTKLGKKYTITFTETDIKLGFKGVMIKGVKYKIDLNGKMTKV